MQLAERIAEWLRGKVVEARREGIVVGLSGGIDSATVAALSKKAMGEKVLGLIMPCGSIPADERDALLAVRSLGIKSERVDLTPMFEMLLATFPPGRDLARANLKPRLRMMTLYYFANNLNYLVAGTGNKSELMVGYFTKYGDGGVDVLPLGGLVKTQVRELANELKVPQEIVERVPSAGLWEGQTDEGEMGITYEELDRTIQWVEVGDLSRCDPQTLETVRRLYRASEHKRSLAEVFYPEERKAFIL
ncbi:MAG: NAD+ synthase [Dehalococcoidia bacterium]|nr:NAD+ synthase [Dehalococcoidia bacterium]